MLDALAFLLQPTELGITVFHGPARFDELLVDQETLVEVGLPFGFQFGDGIGARGELLVDLVATRHDLAKLCIETGQRLFQRGERGALGLHAQRQLVRLVGRFARVDTRFLTRLEQFAAFVFQAAAFVFTVAHVADGFIEARARIARSGLRVRRAGRR